MTLHYKGIHLQSQGFAKSAQLYPAQPRRAKNNRSKAINMVEVVEVDQIVINVTKSNIKEFHTFFTSL